MSMVSLSELELQHRAFGQYLNYLIIHQSIQDKTTTMGSIQIEEEIRRVQTRINDVMELIRRIRIQIEN